MGRLREGTTEEKRDNRKMEGVDKDIKDRSSQEKETKTTKVCALRVDEDKKSDINMKNLDARYCLCGTWAQNQQIRWHKLAYKMCTSAIM